MQLLSHEDPNVRYEALVAVQKLMVHNWYVLISLSVSKEDSNDFISKVSKIYFTKMLDFHNFREYLGKQLEKESEGSSQSSGQNIIQGKA